MRKIFITTLIYFITSFCLYASSPNGKSLICKCISIEKCPKKETLFWNTYISQNGMPSEIAISFKDNVAVYHYIRIFNDKVAFTKEQLGSNGGKYSFFTTKESIHWQTSEFNLTSINRKTLIYHSLNTYPNGYNKKNSLHFRKCEVIGNGDLFIRLKELVNHYQTEYNKQLKDNKI